MTLHVGDRILEVNGTPVKDQPIENIENLIRYSDTVLQVKSTNNFLYVIKSRLIYLFGIIFNS